MGGRPNSAAKTSMTITLQNFYTHQPTAYPKHRWTRTSSGSSSALSFPNETHFSSLLFNGVKVVICIDASMQTTVKT